MFDGIMEPENQPSILPFFTVVPHFSLLEYQTALCDYLEANSGKYHEIMSDIANPGSLIYDHLQKAFFDNAPCPADLLESDQRLYFHQHVIKPLLMFSRLGERAMARNLGAQINSPMTSTKPAPPSPPKTAEPVRQVVPPPLRPPTSSFGGGGNAPGSFADSSVNSIYMSNLPEGVSGNPALVRELLLTLGFPPNLVKQVPFIVRQFRREGAPQACFLVGPSDYPGWADAVLESKPDSYIKYTQIHMAKATPKRKQDSPGRRQRVADIAAEISKISGGGAASPKGSPFHMQQSPAASPPPRSQLAEGGDGRKRGIGKVEGQVVLTYRENGEEDMQVDSTPSAHRTKQANNGQTPAPIRGMRLRAMLGHATGSPAHGGGGSLPVHAGDEVDVAGGSPSNKEAATDQVELDDAIPATPAKGEVRGDESKGDEVAMPN